jgi:hypothetical protein
MSIFCHFLYMVEQMSLLNNAFFLLKKSRYLDFGSPLTHCLIRQYTGNTANDLWPRIWWHPFSVVLTNAAEVLLLSGLHFQRAKMRNHYLWPESMLSTFSSSQGVLFAGALHGHVYVNCLIKLMYCFDSGHSFLQDVLLENYSYHAKFTLEQSM